MRRWGSVIVIALLVAACGRGPVQSASTATSTGDGWAPRLWYDASYANATHDRVRLQFDGPAGGKCTERDYAVADETDPEVVVVSVRFDNPGAPRTCALQPRSIVVRLAKPLGRRSVRRLSDNVAFHDENGRLALIPDSTACGRADCSTPSPTPAPCTPAAYDDAIRTNIDGGLNQGDARCDGSFLVLGVDNNSACQPEQYGQGGCTLSERGFFVARNGTWNIVTVARGATCDDVWRSARIRFPEPLCAAL